MVEVLLIALLTLAASAVGTVTGFGTSTIMVPVLLFYYPMPQVLLLVGIVHLAGNLWRMLFFPTGLPGMCCYGSACRVFWRATWERP